MFYINNIFLASVQNSYDILSNDMGYILCHITRFKRTSWSIWRRKSHRFMNGSLYVHIIIPNKPQETGQ